MSEQGSVNGLLDDLAKCVPEAVPEEVRRRADDEAKYRKELSDWCEVLWERFPWCMGAAKGSKRYGIGASIDFVKFILSGLEERLEKSEREVRRFQAEELRRLRLPSEQEREDWGFPEGFRDKLTTEIEIRFDWRDRLRVLVHGEASLRVETFTEWQPGCARSQSRPFVRPVFRNPFRRRELGCVEVAVEPVPEEGKV